MCYPQGLFPHRTSPSHTWPQTQPWSPGAATRDTSQMALWSTWPEGWIPGVASCPTGEWDRTPSVSWPQGSTTTLPSRRSETRGRSRSTACLSTLPSLPVSCVQSPGFVFFLSNLKSEFPESWNVFFFFPCSANAGQTGKERKTSRDKTRYPISASGRGRHSRRRKLRGTTQVHVACQLLL